MKFGPDASTRVKHQQPYALATVAEGHHKQAGAAILTALWIKHQGTSAIIHLRFLPWIGDDHGARLLLQLRRVQFVNESFDALIAVREAMLSDQVLPDSSRVTSTL